MSRSDRTDTPIRRALRIGLGAVLLYVTAAAPVFSTVLPAEIIEIVEKSVVQEIAVREPPLDARDARQSPSHDLQPVRPHPQEPPTPPPQA